MTQFLVTLVLLVVAVAAVVGSYRLIVSDGGGARRTPLPAEPSGGNTILPHPRSRHPQAGHVEDVLAERRRVHEQRRIHEQGAQYFGGRVNV